MEPGLDPSILWTTVFVHIIVIMFDLFRIFLEVRPFFEHFYDYGI